MKFNEVEKSEEEDYNYIMRGNSDLNEEWLEDFRKYFLEKISYLKNLNDDNCEKKVFGDAENYLKSAFFRKMIIKYKDKIFTNSEQEHFNFIRDNDGDLDFTIKRSDEKEYTRDEKIILRKMNRFYNMLEKLTHTARVVKDTNQMLSKFIPEENLEDENIIKESILYAALYHDIGRFYEASRYDNFGKALEDGEPTVNLIALDRDKFDHATAGYWYGVSDGLDYEEIIKEHSEDEIKKIIIENIGAIIVMLHQQSNSNLAKFDGESSDGNIATLLRTKWSNPDRPETKKTLYEGVRELYKYAAKKGLFMSENKEKNIIENTDKKGKVDFGSTVAVSIDTARMEVLLLDAIKLGLHTVMGVDRIDILRQWEKGTYPRFEKILNPENIEIDLFDLIKINRSKSKTLRDAINEFIGIDDEEKERKIATKIVRDIFKVSEEERIEEILNTNIDNIELTEWKNKKNELVAKRIEIKPYERVPKTIVVNNDDEEKEIKSKGYKYSTNIPVSYLRPYTDEEIVERFILGGEKRFEEFKKDMSRDSLDGIKYSNGILGLLWNINQFIFVNARTRGQLEIIKNQDIIENIRKRILELKTEDESKISGEAIVKVCERYFDFAEKVLEEAVDKKNNDNEKKLHFVFKPKEIKKVMEDVKDEIA